MEMLEAKLELMNGKTVILVRPSFGTQSDSWIGDLLMYDTTTYPIKFQVADAGHAIIFTTEDIQSTRLLTSGETRFVINLKGPKDYI